MPDSTPSSPSRSTPTSSSGPSHGSRSGAGSPSTLDRIGQVTPEQLSAAIRAALQSAVDAGDLAITVPAEVRVERPRNRDHGDWATNIALQLAKGAGIRPAQLATALATHLASVAGVKAVDIAGPGFLNITLDAASAGELARAIVEAGSTYGHGRSEAGRVVNLEFISANPTGPLHLGHTRWAALGDAMRRVLVAAGAEVAARVLHQRRRRADGQVRRLRPRPRAGRASRPRTATRRVRRRLAPPRCSRSAPTPRPRPRGCRRAGPRPRLHLAARRHPAHAGRLRRALRRVVLRARRCTTAAPSSRRVATLREQGHVFDDGRSRVAAHHRLRRRQGPGPHPGRRRAPPTSPPTPRTTSDKTDRGFDVKHLPARRRPPRLRQPAQGHRRLRRRRPGAQHRGPDRSAGQSIKAGERHGQARGQRHHIDELLEWIGVDAVRYSLARYPADCPAHRSTATCCASAPTTTRSSTSSTRTRGRPAWRGYANDVGVAPRGRLRRGTARRPRPRRRCSPSSATSRGSSPSRPHLREPHRVARYLEELAGASTSSTTPAGCAR